MLNFAFVGCGGMAHWHAKQLRQIPGVNVAALVDPVEPSTAAFKKDYFPDARCYGSFEDLLANPPAKLDAVLLMTPHTSHYPQAKAAMRHGLHVLVEKPMVTSLPHAYDLWRTARSLDRTLAISIQAPYTREYQCLAGLRDSGQWGKVQMVNGYLSQGWLAATQGKWRQDPAISGGGMIYDSGAHVLNGIMWLMNEPVVQVGCFMDNCSSPVDITGVAILRFQSGVLGSLAIGGNGPQWDTTITIQTDTLIMKTAPHGGWLDVIAANGRKIYPHVDNSDTPAGFTPHLNFVNTLLGREQLICPARYGALLSALMDALYLSVRERRFVDVEPVPAEIE